jgi:hypothetical protein
VKVPPGTRGGQVLAEQLLRTLLVSASPSHLDRFLPLTLHALRLTPKKPLSDAGHIARIPAILNVRLVFCFHLSSFRLFSLVGGGSYLSQGDHGSRARSRYFAPLPLSFRKGWGVIVGGLTLRTITCHEQRVYPLSFCPYSFRGETRAWLFAFFLLSALIIHPC